MLGIPIMVSGPVPSHDDDASFHLGIMSNALTMLMQELGVCPSHTRSVPTLPMMGDYI